MDEHQRQIISNLQNLGETAFAEYWNQTSLRDLESNWWKALLFAFDHVFFQGRRDSLSQRYRNHAVATLQKVLELPAFGVPSSTQLDRAYALLQQVLPTEEETKAYIAEKQASKSTDKCSCADPLQSESVGSLLKSLTPHFSSHVLRTKHQREVLRDRLPLNKPADLLMLLGLLRFVLSDASHRNIVGFLADSVRHGDFRTPHASLDRVYGIDDKVASFLLRDTYLLLRRDGHTFPPFPADQWKYLFPIDTWVERVASSLGCSTSSRHADIKAYFVDLCCESPEARFDPAAVAQGLWYAGTHSLDIFVRLLGEIDLAAVLDGRRHAEAIYA